MAARGVKAKSHEKLDSTNVQKVIDLLGGDEPITKKEACEILNIRYNTTRLQRIIGEYTSHENSVFDIFIVFRIWLCFFRDL